MGPWDFKLWKYTFECDMKPNCWWNLHPYFSTWPWAMSAGSHDKSIFWLYSWEWEEWQASSTHSAVQAAHRHVSVGEAAGAQLGAGEHLKQTQWKPLEQGQLLLEMPGCSRTLSSGPQAGPTSTKPSQWWWWGAWRLPQAGSSICCGGWVWWRRPPLWPRPASPWGWCWCWWAWCGPPSGWSQLQSGWEWLLERKENGSWWYIITYIFDITMIFIICNLSEYLFAQYLMSEKF